MSDLAAIVALFESEAMSPSYGEDISVRTHMLQCAELAVAKNLADELVAAALLHDIGWAHSEAAHEDTSADLLAPVFGEAVAAPVRLHVAAKRYLVTTQAGYTHLLSTESRRTLALQGGAFTQAQCADFALSLGFAKAIALRELDDAAKERREAATCIGDYRALLERLATTYAAAAKARTNR